MIIELLKLGIEVIAIYISLIFFVVSAMMKRMTYAIILLFVAASILFLAITGILSIGESKAIGSPTDSIDVGQEYLLIGISVGVEGKTKRFLNLEKEGEYIFYETAQDKFPPPAESSNQTLSPGDIISVLNDGKIVIVKDY